jgi:hypothetical protein
MGRTYNRAARWKVFLIAQKFRRQIELAFGGKGGHIPRRTLN